MTVAEYVRNRIEELKAERDNFIVQSRNQVVIYNSVIGELEEALKAEGEDGGRSAGE